MAGKGAVLVDNSVVRNALQDVTVLVRHVLTILLDPHTKQQLQLAALQTALHFSPDEIADRWVIVAS